MDPSSKNSNSFFGNILYTKYDIRAVPRLLDFHYRLIQSSQRKISSSQFFFYCLNHYSLMTSENQFIVEIKASVSVNKELILLYWNIGKEILQRQQQEGWGTRVIDRLSADLKHTFPDMTGFSSRNLKYMRANNYVISLLVN